MSRQRVRIALVLGAVALLVAKEASSGPPSPSPLGPWYEFRNGSQNTGLSSVAARAVTAGFAGRTPWAFPTHGLVWGTPVVDGSGNIYVGSADKSFYSLAPDGTLRWSFTLPDVGDSLIDSAATLTPAGYVVVPGGDGAIHALDAATGLEAWKFASLYGSQTTGVLVGSFEGNVTLGPDGRLYAGSDDGHLYCVDQTGVEQWDFATGMMVWSAPAFDPTGTWLAFGSLDKSLYVLDRASGQEIAHFTGGAAFKASPAIDAQGRIYVGCSDFTFGCYELQTTPQGTRQLARVWSVATQGEIYSSPALSGDRLVFGSQDGNVYCVSTTGQSLWTYSCYSRISSSPLVTADGVVLIGAKNGKLYALDLTTGKRIWSFKTSPGYQEVNLDSSPALDATGRIIVGSYDGSIYGIPFEFALQNPTDPRVSLDPRNDTPDFGGPVPQNAAILRYVDTDGSLKAQVPPLDPETRLTFRIVAMENGSYVPNAAICYDFMTVTVNPPVPVTVTVGTDRSCLNVEPQGFWQPGVTYTLHVQGSYYHKGNPFLDLLKWFGLPSFRGDAKFTIAPGPTALPAAPVGSVLRYSVHRMYLGQPEILDTLVPAAVAGQAFIATVPVSNAAKGTLGLLVLPAYPRPDGSVVLRPDPTRVFVMNGTFQGDAVQASGKTSLAAMGSEIPFDPIRLTCRLTATGIVGGQVHATAPLLEIKANGTSNTGLSWSAIFDLADPSLDMQGFGSFEGDRLQAPSIPVARASTTWSGSDLLVTLDRTSTFTDDHTVTALLMDDSAGTIVGSASETLLAGPMGQSTLLAFYGLNPATAARAHVRLAIFFDGEPLP